MLPPLFTLGSRGGGVVDSCVVLVCKEQLILWASHLPLMLWLCMMWDTTEWDWEESYGHAGKWCLDGVGMKPISSVHLHKS